jgi:mono/diheme cytochrome c family protein
MIRGGIADEHVQRVIREVKAWQDGGAIYEAHCTRCHGSDGKDTGYPFIKSLGGIGTRHSEEEIWRLTVATGVVDLSRLSEKEQTALAIYVVGL